jgi:hypothetical protein
LSRNHVFFTARGNATGKSTALAVTGAAKHAQAVFDSPFSKPEHAQRLVEQALAAGNGTVIYVSGPLHEIFPAMLERARSRGVLNY